MEKLIEDFSVGLFFWQLVLFVGLILLLKKFAWKPILDSVNEREDGIKSALASAEEAKKEMLDNLSADFDETPCNVVATIHSGPRGAFPHGKSLSRIPK